MHLSLQWLLYYATRFPISFPNNIRDFIYSTAFYTDNHNILSICIFVRVMVHLYHTQLTSFCSIYLNNKQSIICQYIKKTELMSSLIDFKNQIPVTEIHFIQISLVKLFTGTQLNDITTINTLQSRTFITAMSAFLLL